LTVQKLGGTPAEPKNAGDYKFPIATMKSQTDVLRIAANLEKGAVSAYLGAVTRDRLDRISAMVERGTLNLLVGEVLGLADASTAHRVLDGVPHKPGKIVLKVAD
jgi:NADPH:quinone reductase-like Zn-dependent oxidoreductase